MPPYVAGLHSCADKFVPRHLSAGFGQLPFGHGDPLANQFDGSFLIGFVCKEIPHDSRFSLGIESRDPDIPSCWHSWHYAPQLSLVKWLPSNWPTTWRPSQPGLALNARAALRLSRARRIA